MAFSLTKKKIIGVLVVTITVMVAVEVLIIRAGWHITMDNGGNGCACVGPAGITFGQGAILGFGALFVAGWLWGISVYVRTIVRTKKMLRVLKGASVSQKGLEKGLVFFQGGVCEAFTFGILKPRIAICAHCAETLPPEELQAMLAHEAAHACARDPLWFLTLDVLRAAFFFVPLIKQLTQWFRTAAELAADAQVDNRKALGGALLRSVDGIRRTAQEVFAISTFASQIEERMERLINPAWSAQRRLRGASVLISLVILLGSLGSIYGSGHGIAEERLTCNKRSVSSACHHPFDGSVNQYYNRVPYSS